MSWSMTLIAKDGEHLLSTGDYHLVSLDGLGHAEVARIAERGPQQHGTWDLGYRLQPRYVALVLMARGGNDTDWLARRNEIARLFRASTEAVHLRLDSGTISRQLDCYLDGMMELGIEVGTVPGWQRVGIELVAPDPTWYDPTMNAVLFTLGAGSQRMEIPLAIPWQIGTSVIDSIQQLNYAGTWDTWPVIIVNGPITDCVITNETMGDKLDFTGTTIALGDSYVIDCRYGYKTVTRTSDGANRLQDLTDDSNLSTFRIGAHPDVVDGLNIFRVTGTGAAESTKVKLQFYVRYVGV